MNFRYAIFVGDAFSSRYGVPPVAVLPEPDEQTNESATSENVSVCGATPVLEAAAKPPAPRPTSAIAIPAYLRTCRMRYPLQGKAS
jgi:hypothetical protein